VLGTASAGVAPSASVAAAANAARYKIHMLLSPSCGTRHRVSESAAHAVETWLWFDSVGVVAQVFWLFSTGNP
jgi:hypothetical protein